MNVPLPSPPTSADPWSLLFYYGSIVSRLFVVLPAALLVHFFSRKQNELFRLKEEYTHKFSVAASLHGFKIESPKYYEEITAAAFNELLKNPAATPNPQPEAGTQLTWAQRLIEPVVKKYFDKLLDIKAVTKVDG